MSNARSFFGNRKSKHVRQKNHGRALTQVNQRDKERDKENDILSFRSTKNTDARNHSYYYKPGMDLLDCPLMSFEESDSESDHGNMLDLTGSYGQSTNKPDPIFEVKILLQQQQAMMRTLLTKQEAYEDRQLSIETQVTELQEKVLNVMQAPPTPSSSTDGSPGGGKKRKRVVTRELSVSLLSYPINLSCVLFVLCLKLAHED